MAYSSTLGGFLSFFFWLRRFFLSRRFFFWLFGTLVGTRAAGFSLRASRRARSRELLEPGPQPGERELAVAVLAPLVPGGHADAGGEVDEADPALGRVLMLATGSAGPEGLHSALGEECVVVFGNDDHVASGGFAALVRIGHGLPCGMVKVGLCRYSTAPTR